MSLASGKPEVHSHALQFFGFGAAASLGDATSGDAAADIWTGDAAAVTCKGAGSDCLKASSTSSSIKPLIAPPFGKVALVPVVKNPR